MKINTTPKDDHQVLVSVELEQEILESSKRKAAKKIAKKVKIPGFRPGKAPYNVIQKHVGDGAIFEDAINILLDDIYPKVVEEAEITPYGPGALEKIESTEPPIFEFLIPLAPEVALHEYREMRIDFEEKQVEEKDIDAVINNLRDNQAVIEPVERAAKEGDLVYILLNGERKDEEDDSKKALIEDRRFPVVIEPKDADTSNEFPFEGFSRKLLRLKAGSEKEVEYKFKKSYEAEELRGVTGVYKIIVEEVKSRTLPEVTDDFAKESGNYETVEEMRDEIKKSLISQFETEQNSSFENSIIDEMIEKAEIKSPPQMLEHEMEHFIEDLQRQLQSQGMNIELYLKSRDMDMDALKEEIKPSAEERMKRGLILMEVANAEGIQVTAEEVEEKTKQTIEEVRMYFPEEDANKLLTGEALQGLVSRIISDEIIKRTLDRLRLIAKGEEIPSEKEEDNEEAEPEETSKEETAIEVTDDNAEEAVENDTELTNASADAEEEVSTEEKSEEETSE